MMTQEPSGDRLAQLNEVAHELLDEIAELTKDSGDQFVSLARRARTNRRMIWALVVSFALTGLALWRVDTNNARIDSLTHRLDVAQTDTRAKAWCPLYQLFIDAESPEGRKAAADPEAYDHAFKVIKDGYDALKCSEFTEAAPPFTKGQ